MDGGIDREAMRAFLEPVTGQITRLVTDRMTEWGAQRFSSRLVERAVRAGVTSFLDVLDQEDRSGQEVDELFVEVGRLEALQGYSMENLRSVLMLATHTSWRILNRVCRDLETPQGIIGRLGDALFEHMEHIERQMTLGHLTACVEMRHDAARWRGALAAELLAGQDDRELEHLAAANGWQIPEQVQVVAFGVPESETMPALDWLPDPVLVHRDGSAAGLVGPVADVHEVLDELSSRWGSEPARAVSWPVSPYDAAAGFRWARRALELGALGILPVRPELYCADYVATLWVHAEPLMLQRVWDGQLQPLLSEAPRNRLVLAETLLLFLETRGSATSLAAQLGVHAQTVRYRLRRLRELFGDAVDDPNHGLPLLLALQASVPLWRAELDL